MAEYTVTWTIQVDAVSALQAAKIAKWYQLHGDCSSAFSVENHETGREVTIDLDEVLTEDDWVDIAGRGAVLFGSLDTESR